LSGKKADWILSNRPLSRGQWPYQAEWLGIHCGSTEQFSVGIDTGTVLVLEGYAIPRLGRPKKNKLLRGEKIPFADAQELSISVKGHFTIAWANSEGITLCVDHHGMSKVFIGQKGNGWWVANNLLDLVRILNPVIDEIGVMLFNLFEHFIGNRTMFNDIRYSQPAATLNLKESGISESVHWHPKQWLAKPKNHSNIGEWMDFWKELISGYLNGLETSEPRLTLTGGNDSRLILAALQALGARPSAFTFGNPESYDGIISAEVSRQTGIVHQVHYIERPNSEWFQIQAREIVRQGNGMINIHRAHRLDAIRKEVATSVKQNTLFAGFMGGDYLKGLSYDDYITAKLMRLWKAHPRGLRDHLRAVGGEKCLRLDPRLSECLVEDVIPALAFADPALPIQARELLYLFEVVGSLHDYQDTAVFSWEIGRVVNPFMDVDFLERLWSSPYSSLNNRARGSASRVDFCCRLTHALAPEMSDIPYAKWGGYTAREVISSPRLLVAKRIWRHLMKTDRHARSFSYGEWFSEYAFEELSRLHQEIQQFYDMDRLIELPGKGLLGVNEGNWHRVTNPINLSLNWRHFTENENEDRIVAER